MARVFRGPGVFGAFVFVFRAPTVFWDFAHVFRGPNDPDLAHVFRGLGFLDLGSGVQRTMGFLRFCTCFQRTKSSGSWLMFLEDQRF